MPTQWAAGMRLTAARLKDADSVHVCKLAAQAPGQSIPSGTDTLIQFGSGSEDFDTDGWHTTGINTARVTVDRPGFYDVIAHVTWAFNTTFIYGDVAIRKNGVALWRSGNIAPTTTNGVNKNGGTLREIVDAVEGDYFEMSALQTSTGAVVQALNTGSAGVRFTVRYLGLAA